MTSKDKKWTAEDCIGCPNDRYYPTGVCKSCWDPSHTLDALFEAPFAKYTEDVKVKPGESVRTTFEIKAGDCIGCPNAGDCNSRFQRDFEKLIESQEKLAKTVEEIAKLINAEKYRKALKKADKIRRCEGCTFKERTEDMCGNCNDFDCWTHEKQSVTDATKHDCRGIYSESDCLDCDACNYCRERFEAMKIVRNWNIESSKELNESLVRDWSPTDQLTPLSHTEQMRKIANLGKVREDIERLTNDKVKEAMKANILEYNRRLFLVDEDWLTIAGWPEFDIVWPEPEKL